MKANEPRRPRRISADVVGQRLWNQKLVRSDLRTPAEVVSWLGAVQSQDYAGAKWALSQRAPGLTDADVDEAFNAGSILRTHVLRPTWHFVPSADIRWMLALTGPRIQALNRFYYQRAGLDKASLARCRRTLERALGAGRHQTRAALAAALSRAGFSGDGQWLAYVMMHAELEQVICSGPRHGKQFTYALLDERAPRGRALAGDEALAELTRRYFASHGPATIRDFVWWSGLTVKLAKAGLEILGRAVVSDTVDGLTYWSVASSSRTRPVRARGSGPAVYLLPNYDEYLVAHKDRGHSLDPTAPPTVGFAAGFPHQLVIDGILSGAWSRMLTSRAATIVVRPFRPLSRDERRALADAVGRYGTFLGLPAELSLT